MLKNRTSESGFRAQFELEYLRKKEEEKKKKEEEKKKKESIAKHKEKIEQMNTKSVELQAYVQQHFDL